MPYKVYIKFSSVRLMRRRNTIILLRNDQMTMQWRIGGATLPGKTQLSKSALWVSDFRSFSIRIYFILGHSICNYKYIDSNLWLGFQIIVTELWPWRQSRHSGDIGVTWKPTRLVCWLHSKIREQSKSQSGRLWYHTKNPLNDDYEITAFLHKNIWYSWTFNI